MCDVADSVFGIGHHPHYRGSQYVMQTRARTMPIYWDHSQPPRFTIERREDAFIGPKFDSRFAEQLDEDTALLIYRIKQLHDEGRSIREIARDIGASKSRVERLLKKWTPDLGRYLDERLDEDDDNVDLVEYPDKQRDRQDEGDEEDRAVDGFINGSAEVLPAERASEPVPDDPTGKPASPRQISASPQIGET